MVLGHEPWMSERATTAAAAAGVASPAAVLTCRQVYDEMQDLLGRCSSTTKKKLIRNYTRRIDMSQRQYVVETALFPLPALRVYSLYNLGQHAELTKEEQTRYFSAQRGGAQGDYHDGMPEKITNVVQCLHQYPASKRAVITIPNTSFPDHTHDADAKCLRELHFYLDEKETTANSSSTTTTAPPHFRLNATVWMRAQAAEIFPKNIHFIGTLMTTIATALTAAQPPRPPLQPPHPKNPNTSEEEDNEAADHHKRDAEEENTTISTNEKHGGTMVVDVGELFYLATTLVSVRDD